MANKSRISIAANSIRNHLLKFHPHIHHPEELRSVLQKGKKKWNLPEGMNFQKFVEGLTTENIIDFCHLDFQSESYEGYFLPSSPDEYVVAQLVSNAHLSHASALDLWGLTEQPGDKAGNYEQSEISRFRLEVTGYDIYMTYRMTDAAYPKEWRLYYPKTLSSISPGS